MATTYKLIGTTDEHAGRCEQCSTRIRRASVLERLDDGTPSQVFLRVGSTCASRMVQRKVTRRDAEKAQHATIERAKRDDDRRTYAHVTRNGGDFYLAWEIVLDIQERYNLTDDQVWEVMEPHINRRERYRREVEAAALAVDAPTRP